MNPLLPISENFRTTYLDNYRNFWQDVIHPSFGSYFYWFIILSLFVFSLEILFPWRKKQKKLRRDFWQDLFYSFFNLFLFPILIFSFISTLLTDGLLVDLGWDSWRGNRLEVLPAVAQVILLFVIKDFMQWCIHRSLHYSDFLWRFHKVHHSVREMGFAAHLRYHWMENVVYNSLLYLPLSMIGFGVEQYLLVYVIAILVGHLNHANFYLPLGLVKYIFNSPQMHIWHHAKGLPEERRYGCNFGLTLSLWDYLFKTAYIPKSGRDIELGFEGVEEFPEKFVNQQTYGFSKEKK